MSPNLAIIFLPKKFNEVQLMEWIRAKNLTSEYPIGKSYAQELLNQFRAQSDDWIKDGRVLMVKKDSFETWWKQRGEKHEK